MSLWWSCLSQLSQFSTVRLLENGILSQRERTPPKVNALDSRHSPVPWCSSNQFSLAINSPDSTGSKSYVSSLRPDQRQWQRWSPADLWAEELLFPTRGGAQPLEGVAFRTQRLPLHSHPSAGPKKLFHVSVFLAQKPPAGCLPTGTGLSWEIVQVPLPRPSS